MKFTLNNDHQSNRMMNTLLSGLLLFCLLFLTADIILKAEHFGTTFAEISLALYGDEASFIDPMPFSTLLEGLHADIFFTMMTLLTLGAIYGRVGRSKKLRLILINIMMLSALLSLLAPLGAFFISSAWIMVWMAMFLIWHVIAIFVSIISLWRLHFP